MNTQTNPRILWGALVGLVILGVVLAGICFSVYTFGVVQGMADGSRYVAPAAPAAPAPAPAPYVVPYYGRPWGFGGFLGCLGPLFFLFLVFVLVRGFFWHRRGMGWGPYGSGKGGGIHNAFEEWHRKQHEEKPEQKPETPAS